MATYFSQSCPTCGRKLQVRVQFLGRQLSCRHCHGEFMAAQIDERQPNLQSRELMNRVDRLLRSTPQNEVTPSP